jgi:methionine synthase I (cobalamin-dependent)/5,10-methylenetetrahydrofolate reductase
MPHQHDPFLAALADGPLLCDGAMGTLIYARVASLHGTQQCFDELNRTQPAVIQAIHQEYIAAGARIVETNTFGANRVKLGQHGLADDVRAINRAGVRLAREAREVAGQPVYVAGSVGPIGLGITAPDDPDALAELQAVFREQIDALVEGGADFIILETIAHAAEMRAAVLAAHAASDLPVVAQMTFTEDGTLLTGQTPGEIVRMLAELRVDVIGANCGMGPAGTLDVVAAMAEALRALPPDVPRPWLSAMPNAGLPARVEGRFLYVSTPDYFADYTRHFTDAGVRLVGGCCGTTPQHTAAMALALADRTNTPTVFVPAIIPERRTPEEDALLPDASMPTRWQARLASGQFAVSVELDPPKGLSPKKVLAGAETLRKRGVEFINIADSPTARVRMSCIALARLLRDLLDIEPIVHFTTRDRNLMALQSDLLGAHALGLRNILALTGDPLRAGDYPNLTGVWNIDSVGLVRVLRGMNAGHDAGGAPLGGQAAFHIGAALDVNVGDAPIDLAIERARNKIGPIPSLHGNPAPSPPVAAQEPCSPSAEGEGSVLTEQELEFSRLQAKIAAGAHYIMTQFIYDLEPLRQFHARFGPLPVPLILGLSPLYSFKHAEFLHNEVRGITIPTEVRARMRAAGDRGREVGLEIAHELITTARHEGLIQGCYLLPSYGRYDLVAELAAALLRG